MERVVRLLALFALFALLVAGCGKDTVSNPGGGSGLAGKDAPSDGGVASANEEGAAQGSASAATDSGTAGTEGSATSVGGADGPTPDGAAASSNGVVLRYNLKKGEKYAYEVKAVMDGLGQPLTMTIQYQASVIDAKPNLYKVEYKINDIAVSTKDPQQKAMFEQQMSAMKGQSFTADVNPRGEASNAQGPGAQMLQGLAGGAVLGMIYPEKALQVGGKWTHSVDAGPGGPVKMTYELAGVSRAGGREVATLVGSGNHKSQMDGGGGQQGGGGQMTVESSMNGTSKVDLATGMLIESSLKFVTKLSGGGMPGQTQNVSVTVKRK